MHKQNNQNNQNYIKDYKNEKVKEIVKKSKNLDQEALKYIAKELYEYICSDIGISNNLDNQSDAAKSSEILILHAPSSSFTRQQKKKDHMALICGYIKEFNDADRSTNKPKIDICPNFFLIDMDQTKSQHEKTREERLLSDESKFTLLYKQIFGLGQHGQAYKYIYIVDDVLTTGATLSTLVQIIQNIVSNLPETHSAEVKSLAFCH